MAVCLFVASFRGFGDDAHKSMFDITLHHYFQSVLWVSIVTGSSVLRSTPEDLRPIHTIRRYHCRYIRVCLAIQVTCLNHLAVVGSSVWAAKL